MVLISEIHRIYVNVYLIIFPREEISMLFGVLGSLIRELFERS